MRGGIDVIVGDVVALRAALLVQVGGPANAPHVADEEDRGGDDLKQAYEHGRGALGLRQTARYHRPNSAREHVDYQHDEPDILRARVAWREHVPSEWSECKSVGR